MERDQRLRRAPRRAAKTAGPLGAVCSGAAAIERVPVCGLAVKRSFMHHPPSLKDLFVTRRSFLTRCGMGMGAMSLAALFGETGLVPSARAAANVNPLSP